MSGGRQNEGEKGLDKEMSKFLCHFAPSSFCHSEGVLPKWEGRPKNLRDPSLSLRVTKGKLRMSGG